jgi:hypothetical protein
MTSKASQAHDATVTLPFLPAEASAGISVEQMLVTISRAREELLMFTDSLDVVRECATRSGERESATEFVWQRGWQRRRPAATS